ncbi:hypothetical protein TTHERM_01081670 (macronuclear) [Tetrahymena thermophila SB210]|uniref:Uncharacterized protein n=1 Tax=Tetrahymena thermophila (strain SB210) TaxID=312017 RepID=Q22C02_TETTS|nr:hypothetical protein TTHERM_01081670 [Tetrahymena thermophila SB210]EAR82807.1 hypothetical protein TTHERM_01081670 [Tetrahymena thermophila SB210]|eukprot:XP_001030470.1 hypothetical protein TTHERM_01081670 [Tetrahymena thermophila SB210]
MTKKQLRQATLKEFKKCFLEYFDDFQSAAFNLVCAYKSIPKKVVHYNYIVIEVGYGLLLSVEDNKNKNNTFRSNLDYFDKIMLLFQNQFQIQIALDLVDEVAETFDQFSQKSFNYTILKADQIFYQITKMSKK